MHSPARLAVAILAAMLAAVALLAASLAGLRGPQAEGQAITTLAVDADPAGNLADSIGQIDDCVVLDLGETADIDVVLLNVDGLLGFDFHFEYDPSIVEIQDGDLRRLFLASASGSRVIDVSEPLPDPDRLHNFRAADIGQDSLDSGSGVLVRVTLTAKGSGVSPLVIPKIDVTGDGKVNLGPRLIGAAGALIGDEDGDEFFDGPRLEASIAVDSACPPPALTPTPTPTPTPPPPDSTPEVGSTPTGDEAVLLLPPVPPEISESTSPGPSTSDSEEGEEPEGETEAAEEGPSDDTSADVEGGTDDDSSAAGPSSSTSGLGLPLWLVVIVALAMLASGGFFIVRALLARR